MQHFPFVTNITTFVITKYILINPKPQHQLLATTMFSAIECAIECSTIIILARWSWICLGLQITQCIFVKVLNRIALMFSNLQKILFLRFIIIADARCKICNQLNSSFDRSSTHKHFCLMVIWIKLPLRHWDWVSQAALAFKLWNNNQD